MIALETGNCNLVIDPARGGAILAFAWRGMPVFRPACGPMIFDTACFALVPFSNRIARGRFTASGHDVRIAPNFPGSDHPHPLHGFGWLCPWQPVQQTATAAELEHHYAGAEWPWPYRAKQRVELGCDSLLIELSVQNLGASPMPCGLGLHPYFPCNDQTHLRARHGAEVVVDAECIPVATTIAEAPKDWWQGQQVTRRRVDTAYLNRSGPLCVTWPDRGMELLMEPSDALPHTVIYTPPGENYFCAEPVSHATNSFNSPVDDPNAHTLLEPYGVYAASCRFTLQSVA